MSNEQESIAAAPWVGAGPIPAAKADVLALGEAVQEELNGLRRAMNAAANTIYDLTNAVEVFRACVLDLAKEIADQRKRIEELEAHQP